MYKSTLFKNHQNPTVTNLKRGGGDIQAVCKGIKQKQNKELVVGPANAIVHPRAEVIHFEDDLFDDFWKIN